MAFDIRFCKCHGAYITGSLVGGVFHQCIRPSDTYTNPGFDDCMGRHVQWPRIVTDNLNDNLRISFNPAEVTVITGTA